MLYKISFIVIILIISLYTIIKKDTTFIAGYNFDSEDGNDNNIYYKNKVCSYWGAIFCSVAISISITLIYDFTGYNVFNIIGSIIFIASVLTGVYFSYNKNLFKK